MVEPRLKQSDVLIEYPELIMVQEPTSATTASPLKTAAYVVPHGWIETYTVDGGHRRCTRFHMSTSCPRIKAESLQQVERPGSAARCRHCANSD